MTEQGHHGATATCPAGDLLRKVAQGTATAAETDSVARHMLNCPACRRWMDAPPNVSGSDPQTNGNFLSKVATPETVTAADSTATTIDSPDAEPLPELPGYRVECLLGQGGMGTVWRAVQLGTQRPVAIKLMSASRFGSPKHRQRFEREVKLAASLEHPNIARVYASGLHEGGYFYVMELIAGQPLDSYILQHKLDHAGILQLLAEVRHAVEYAHQRGVVHRDLKRPTCS